MLGCEEATGIDVVYDVSIKGAQVSIEALTILSEQITVLLRLPKPATSQQAATIFIAVMLDVLSFVHG